jgi:hypothetical protein
VSTITLESLVRPFQSDASFPRPYYPQGQRTPQNIKLRYGGGSGGGGAKTLSTSESGSLTVYCERHEAEKTEEA